MLLSQKRLLRSPNSPQLLLPPSNSTPMGFPNVFIKIPNCISTTFRLNHMTFFKSMFLTALTLLGLHKLPDGQEQADSDDYVLVIDPMSPSPVPVPVHVLTSLIKKSLPVVEYSNLLQRSEPHEDSINAVCAVCLDGIEKIHEIRELCNCSHVFHRECLDRCLDEGYLTCPLCRSMLYLYPTKAEIRG